MNSKEEIVQKHNKIVEEKRKIHLEKIDHLLYQQKLERDQLKMQFWTGDDMDQDNLEESERKLQEKQTASQKLKEKQEIAITELRAEQHNELNRLYFDQMNEYQIIVERNMMKNTDSSVQPSSSQISFPTMNSMEDNSSRGMQF